MQKARLFILSGMLLSGCSVMDSADKNARSSSNSTSYREKRTTKINHKTAEQPEFLALLLPQSQEQNSAKVHGYSAPEKEPTLKVEALGSSPEAEALKYKVYTEMGEAVTKSHPEANANTDKNIGAARDLSAAATTGRRNKVSHELKTTTSTIQVEATKPLVAATATEVKTNIISTEKPDTLTDKKAAPAKSPALEKPAPAESTKVTELDSEKLPTVPGPSTVKRDRIQERNANDAQIYVMENRWFSEKIWLYNDGSYAQRNPQKICGRWKKNEALLILEPSQGGRQIYSPKPNGAWQSEAGGLSTLRPEKY